MSRRQSRVMENAAVGEVGTGTEARCARARAPHRRLGYGYREGVIEASNDSMESVATPIIWSPMPYGRTNVSCTAVAPHV